VINGVGFVIIFACVFGSFIVSGGKLAVILEALPHELTAILGAAIGAFLVGNSLPTAKLAGKGLMRAFKGPRWTSEMYRDLLTLLFALLTTLEAAVGLYPLIVEAAEAGPVRVNASQVQSIFQAMLQVLLAALRSEFGCDVTAASEGLTERLRALGLEELTA